MKALYSFVAVSMFISSSLEAMEKTINKRTGEEISEEQAAALELSQLTNADLQRQVNALAEQHAQFSSAVVAHLAALTEMLKSVVDKQISNEQPKKRTRRTSTSAAQPMSTYPRFANHELESLNAHSITFPGRTLPAEHVQTIDSVTNALPHGPAQPEQPSTIIAGPVDTAHIDARPRITIRPQETFLSDEEDPAMLARSASAPAETTMKTINWAKPRETQPATLVQLLAQTSSATYAEMPRPLFLAQLIEIRNSNSKILQRIIRDLKNKNYAHSIEALKALCNQDLDPSSQVEASYYLGECFYFGEGVPQNYEVAVRLFKKTATEGSMIPRVRASAWQKLGECFYFGHGVIQNHEEAVKLLKKASDDQQVHNLDAKAAALYLLSVAAINGQGIDKDFDLGKQCLRKALTLACDPKIRDKVQNLLTKLSTIKTMPAAIPPADDETEHAIIEKKTL